MGTEFRKPNTNVNRLAHIKGQSRPGEIYTSEVKGVLRAFEVAYNREGERADRDIGRALDISLGRMALPWPQSMLMEGQTPHTITHEEIGHHRSTDQIVRAHRPTKDAHVRIRYRQHIHILPEIEEKMDGQKASRTDSAT